MTPEERAADLVTDVNYSRAAWRVRIAASIREAVAETAEHCARRVEACIASKPNLKPAARLAFEEAANTCRCLDMEPSSVMGGEAIRARGDE